MNVLVVYYSRDGTTKKIGDEIATQLKSDVEELRDTKNRSGISGWLSAGKDSTKKNLTTLEKTSRNPADYDVVLIGTPLWNKQMTPAVRTYLTQNKEAFKNVAFFCTHTYTDDDPFEEMSTLCGKTPLATLILHRKKEIDAKNYADKLQDFVNRVNS